MMYLIFALILIAFLGLIALMPVVVEKLFKPRFRKRYQDMEIVNELISYAKLKNNGKSIDMVIDSLRDKDIVYNYSSQFIKNSGEFNA